MDDSFFAGNEMYVVFAAAFVVIVIWLRVLIKRANDLPGLMKKADELLKQNNFAQAGKIFQSVIIKAENIKTNKPEEYRSKSVCTILGTACRGLGLVRMDSGENTAALELFEKAIDCGVVIPPAAHQLIGSVYLEQNDISPKAVNVYLHIIQIRPATQLNIKIYGLLKQICRIELNMDPDALKKAVELNKKIYAINDKIDWNYFNLGLALYIEGKYPQSLPYFNTASALNSKNILAFYYSALIYTMKDSYNDEEAVSKLESFLALTEQISVSDYLTGRVNFELGKIFLTRIEAKYAGRQTVPPAEDLKKILELFSGAIKLGGETAAYYYYLGKACNLLNHSLDARKAYEKAVKLSPTNPNYLYALAREYYKAGIFETAAEILEKAFNVNPNIPVINELLGDTFAKLKKFEQAENYYTLAKNAKPSVLLLRKLIRVLFWRNKLTQIKQEVISAAIKPSKEYKDEAYCIGRALAVSGEFQEALLWYDISEPANEAVYYRACALANTGNFKSAKTGFESLITTENDFIGQAFLQLGQIELIESRSESAESYLKSARRYIPEDARVLYILGYCFFLKSDLTKAIDCFSKITNSESFGKQACFYLGCIEEQRGNFNEALKYLKLSAADSVLLDISNLRAGIVNCRNGGFAQAIELFKSVPDKYRSTDACLYYYGFALMKCGFFAEAMKYWETLQTRHPADKDLKTDIASLLYLAGRDFIKARNYAKAIEFWENYLKTVESDTATLQNLAVLCYISGLQSLEKGGSADIQNARSIFTRALNLDKDNDLYEFFIGLCGYAAGQYDECIRKFQSVAAKRPNNMRYIYHLGAAHMKHGNRENAIKLFREVLENDDAVFAEHAVQFIAHDYMSNGKFDDAKLLLEKYL